MLDAVHCVWSCSNNQTGRQLGAQVVFLMLLTEVAAWNGVHSRQCGLSLGYQPVWSHSV